MADQVYSDISPKVEGYASKMLLERALPEMPLEQLVMVRPLPGKSTKTMVLRRYLSLSRITTPMAEGVTPALEKMTYEDFSVVLDQFGKGVPLTDQIMDFHDDPILAESTDLLGEITGESKEVFNIEVIKGGTQAAYAGGTTRATVDETIQLTHIDVAIRTLRGNNAKYYKKKIMPTVKYATEPVPDAFFGYTHTDAEQDLKRIEGFLPVHKYADPTKALPNEFGSIDRLRILTGTLCEPWEDSGAAVGATGLKSTSAVNIDVYPMVIMAPNAWYSVPLRRKNAPRVMVLNPGKARGGDPFGQRGSVTTKFYHAGLIVQDLFLYRIEFGVTENPL